MSIEPLLSVSIAGFPSSYSTKREKPWKDALWQQIPEPPAGETNALGIGAHFRVTGPREGHQAVDLDNLCEPLFSVLVNKWKWFSGRRPNIRWFRATKSYDGEPGCDLTVLASGAPLLPDLDSQVRFSASYQGDLPLSARDETFADCIAAERSEPLKGERFSVSLRFGSTKPNLGDIGSGAVKHTVDCLYRVIGGKAGAPEDWRVCELQVEKGVEGIPADCVEITVRSIA